MSLYSSLYTGVSGMQTTSQELSIVGDNVANANTIGFKQSRAAFADVLGQNLATGAGEVGLGSRLQAVQKILTQGALTQTGMATDLAIQGGGFFMVEGPAGENFYTRAGQFTVDQDGYLVNLDGLQVQGYQADSAGQISGSLGSMMVGDAQYPPQITSTVTMRGNLDAGEDIIPAPGFDVTDIANTTSGDPQPVTLYDSLGNAIDAEIHFTKTADGAWDYNVVTDGSNITGGTAGTPEVIAGGSLTYNPDGSLQTHAPNAALVFNPVGAVNPQPLTFDFGTAIADGGTGLDGMTQFGNPQSVQFINQDGFAAGDLTSVTVEDDGTISGAFTNGQTRALGQVVLADFEAADQLQRIGGNLFSATEAAGEANIGRPGTGGRGRIVAGALEQSNVDLASEFVRMIVAQRGFQANSKTVTTSDQLLDTLIQVKR
jgi:flagellar hook protein FlgE